MQLSVFDLFRVGIGPSSSHTVGPMRAARRFAERLEASGNAAQTSRLSIELFGSLAATGKGHGSDVALVLGLEGEAPETVDVDHLAENFARVVREQRVRLPGGAVVPLVPQRDLHFRRRETLPLHPNGLRFRAHDEAGALLEERIYYSVGGGFVINDQGASEDLADGGRAVTHAFESGDQLLARCKETGLAISTLMLENERALAPGDDVGARLLGLAATMEACVKRGCEREGVLPGGLKVVRRAAALHRRLKADPRGAPRGHADSGAGWLAAGEPADPMVVMDWVNLFALAVNEENAAGGRVVTAPTNGAAGIIPAVLLYYRRFVRGADDEGVMRFLLAAGAIGILYKKNASISGAEVGCQGEVGVACSMAAGGLAEVMGGTPAQVENAAEIGMEHNLGLTCDPIGGLVQVPCIERNAMGAVKAINAARLALVGDGSHKVSLDKVIATMRQTGADMSSKYKETARGGLAVNIIEC